MEEPEQLARSGLRRWGLVLVYSAAGFIVVFVGVVSSGRLPVPFILAAQAAVLLVSLAMALILRRSESWRRYWKLAFAYFIAACAITLSWFAGDWALILSGLALETAQGFAVLKLGEDVAIVGTILALTLLVRDDLSELYLARGRLGLGLGVGVASFVILSVLGIASARADALEPARIFAVLPSFAIISLADGFTEELLFRGLFLKKLGRLVGNNGANLITALVFACAHLGAPFAGSPTGLLVVFGLGMALGWLMKKTDSLLAPALVHAGVDMLVIRSMLPAFGVLI